MNILSFCDITCDVNNIEMSIIFSPIITGVQFTQDFGYLQKVFDEASNSNNNIKKIKFDFSKTKWADPIFLVITMLYIDKLAKNKSVSFVFCKSYGDFSDLVDSNGFIDWLTKRIDKVIAINNQESYENSFFYIEKKYTNLIPFTIFTPRDDLEMEINHIVSFLKDSEYNDSVINSIKIILCETIENSFTHGYFINDSFPTVGMYIRHINMHNPSERKMLSKESKLINNESPYRAKNFYYELADNIEIVISDIGIGFNANDLEHINSIEEALLNLTFDNEFSRGCKNIIEYIFTEGKRGKNKLSKLKKSKTGGIDLIYHTLQESSSYIGLLSGFYWAEYNCNKGERKNIGKTICINNQPNRLYRNDFIHGTSFIFNICLREKDTGNYKYFSNATIDNTDIFNNIDTSDISNSALVIDFRFNVPYYYCSDIENVGNMIKKNLSKNYNNIYMLDTFINNLYLRISRVLHMIVDQHFDRSYEKVFSEIFFIEIKDYMFFWENDFINIIKDNYDFIKKSLFKFLRNKYSHICFFPNLYMSKSFITSTVEYYSKNYANTLFIFDIPIYETIKYIHIFYESKKYNEIENIFLIAEDFGISKLTFNEKTNNYILSKHMPEIAGRKIFNVLKYYDSKKFWFMLNCFEINMNLKAYYDLQINWEGSQLEGYLNFSMLSSCKPCFKLLKFILKRFSSLTIPNCTFQNAEPFTESICDQLNFEQLNADIANNIIVKEEKENTLNVGSVYVTGESVKDIVFDGNSKIIYYFNRSQDANKVISLLNWFRKEQFISIDKDKKITKGTTLWTRMGKLPYITCSINRNAFIKPINIKISTEELYKMIINDNEKNNLIRIGHFCNNVTHDFINFDFYSLYKSSFKNSARKMVVYDDFFEFVLLKIVIRLGSSISRSYAKNNILDAKINNFIKALNKKKEKRDEKFFIVYLSEFYTHKIISKIKDELSDDLSKEIIYMPIVATSEGESILVPPILDQELSIKLEKAKDAFKTVTVTLVSSFTKPGYIEIELEKYFRNIGANHFEILSFMDRRLLRNSDTENVFFSKFDFPFLGTEGQCLLCRKISELIIFRDKLIYNEIYINRIDVIIEKWKARKIGKHVEECFDFGKSEFISKKYLQNLINNFVEIKLPEKCNYIIVTLLIVEYIRRTSFTDLLDKILEDKNNVFDTKLKMLILSIVLNLFSTNEISKTAKNRYMEELSMMLLSLQNPELDDISSLSFITFIGEDDIFLKNILKNIKFGSTKLCLEFEIFLMYILERYYDNKDTQSNFQVNIYKNYLKRHYEMKINIVEIVHEYFNILNQSRHSNVIRRLYTNAIDSQVLKTPIEILNRNLPILYYLFNNVQEKFHINCENVIYELDILKQLISKTDVDQIIQQVKKLVKRYQENVENSLYCAVGITPLMNKFKSLIIEAVKGLAIGNIRENKFTENDIAISYCNSEVGKSKWVHLDTMIVDELIYIIRDFRHAISKFTYMGGEYYGIIEIDCDEDYLQINFINKSEGLLLSIDEIKEAKNKKYRLSFVHLKEIILENIINVEFCRFSMIDNMLKISIKIPYLGN